MLHEDRHDNDRHDSVTPDPAPAPAPDDLLDVVVVGAGQSGLATAKFLADHGLRLLVVDAGPAVGHSWRSRWDSLRLFTPARHDALPDAEFPTAELPAPPDSLPTKDQVADHLADYARRFAIPVLLHCRVKELRRADTRDGGDGPFVLDTTQGVLRARQVVVATGAFHQPVHPHWRDGLGDLPQRHSSGYRNPDDLRAAGRAGDVLVVGGGNSGRQIALELAAEPTRRVHLAVGTRALELPQRFLGRDLFWWLTRAGVVRAHRDSALARRMRTRGDLVVGSPLRDLRRGGVEVRPRAVDAVDGVVTFADGSTLRPSAVVWATGFRQDHSWIRVPGALGREPGSGREHVWHSRGISPVPGLAFVGLPWQHTRGSSLLGFVGEDAAWVADQVARTAQQGVGAARGRRSDLSTQG